jgi:hypothetical protein
MYFACLNKVKRSKKKYHEYVNFEKTLKTFAQ